MDNAKYSYVMDFNLKPEGEDANKYLVDMIRTWPELYKEVKGITSTVFFASALGLGGDRLFRMVLELESLRALEAMDDAYKNHKSWKNELKNWFKVRESVKSRLLFHDDEESFPSFLTMVKQRAEPKFVFKFNAPNNVNISSLKRARHAAEFVRTYATIANPGGSHGVEVWATVPNLESIEAFSVASSRIEAVGLSTAIYSELRIIDSALVSAA